MEELETEQVKPRVNVLVVDDRPENLLALEATFSESEAHFEFVRSAEEALRYLLTADVALILLDVQMPGVSGFELAELIRQREQTQNTPIIFISATSVDREYVFQGYSLGAVDYLTKPFEPEILRSKVAFFTALYEKNSEIKRQAKLLEEANASLDMMNEALEERVRQRTVEIETAYRRLGEETVSRARSQARLALEHGITRELSAAESVDGVAPAALRAISDYLGTDLSTFWLVSSDGSALECVHIEVKKQTSAIDLFLRSPLNKKLVKGVGLPGYVWQKDSARWLTLSGADEQFPRAQLAAVAGFTTAVGVPLRVGDEFLGVLEFFSIQPMTEDPEVVRMLEVIGSEIGQFIRRKRVEAEREKLLTQEMTLRQQAERASRLKDEFLATVSHELRTPLNSILGWAQILRREALDDEKRDAALETIFRNSRAQAQLIDDLLDMSRLITGNFPLDLAPTSVRSIVEAAVEIVSPQARAKSIGLSADFHTPDVEITCDAERIQQIVWNLLVNALKFTPEGGSVKVTVNADDSKVSIIVKDDGSGIEPEFLPHVFDRFRQWDSSSTRKHRGLGLGLAIVSNLAELHGGGVSVASEGPGRGSEFTVSLPLTSGSKTSDVRADTNGSNGHGPNSSDKRTTPLVGVRILIVEDDPDAAEMLRYALLEAGAEAHAAHSVEDAFHRLAQWTPDALVSDISMPGEDGYSLIKRLRRERNTAISSLPAIALTAMARSEDSDNVLSAGFQMHMPKPVDLDELTSAIVRLITNAKGKSIANPSN